MNKLPFDSILDPQKIEAYVLMNKMVKTLDNPDLNPVERELIVVALETLAKTYIELVDPTEN